MFNLIVYISCLKIIHHSPLFALHLPSIKRQQRRHRLFIIWVMFYIVTLGVIQVFHSFHFFLCFLYPIHNVVGGNSQCYESSQSNDYPECYHSSTEIILNSTRGLTLSINFSATILTHLLSFLIAFTSWRQSS